jgi:hypothetical protein
VTADYLQPPYEGPRFDPAQVMAGRYRGPKLSLRKAEESYSGPRFVLRDTQQDEQPTTEQPSPRYEDDPVFSPMARQRGPMLIIPKSATEQPPPQTQPAAAPAPTAVEQDQARLRELALNAPDNTNSRAAGALRLAAFDAANQARETNSLGRTAGAGIGGLLAGLINRRADEEQIDRPQQLARAQAQLQLDSATEKEQRERAESDARVASEKAQAEHTRTQTRLLPEQVDAAARAKMQATLLSQLRLAGRYKRGENATFDSALDAAGLSVSDFEKGGKLQWHEAGGQVYVMNPSTGETRYATVDGKPVEDASKKPGEDGLTPFQSRTFADHAAEREQRRQIEAERLALERQRGQLSREEFQNRQKEFQSTHPGLGKPALKRSEIEAEQQREDQAASRAGRTPRNLRKEAVAQGYAIDDDN